MSSRSWLYKKSLVKGNKTWLDAAFFLNPEVGSCFSVSCILVSLSSVATLAWYGVQLHWKRLVITWIQFPQKGNWIPRSWMFFSAIDDNISWNFWLSGDSGHRAFDLKKKKQQIHYLFFNMLIHPSLFWHKAWMDYEMMGPAFFLYSSETPEWLSNMTSYSVICRGPVPCGPVQLSIHRSRSCWLINYILRNYC